MKTPAVILVVDDDRNTREGIARALKRFRVITVESVAEALKILTDEPVDLILSDLRMPGEDGLSLLRKARSIRPEMPVILLTAYGSVSVAVEAIKAGAHDFLIKPVDLDMLDLKVEQALRMQSAEIENRLLREKVDEKYGFENIIGSSEVMKRVFEVIKQAASTSATVLIEGASGTGKELVAHALHNLSDRRKGPFVAVHCAALSPTLLESELFGHEKGSFTGASERKKGRFELADGGTLFLDEISEIDLATQVKLLRVLEERRFERVGGMESIEVDIRLVAATNRDLKSYMESGKFREDLYYRLNVVTVSLPPLAKRKDDLPLLCNKFLREFAKENGRAVDGFTPEAMSLLAAYDWPGNVRELRNVINRMVTLSRGGKLGVRDVPEEIRSLAQPKPEPPDLDKLQKRQIQAVLKECGGCKTAAAQKLGISRRTLYRKLDEYEKEGAVENE